MGEGTQPTESGAQSHIIKRPRLTELLDDSGARVILLIAPAGYGKTTLARQWLAAYRRPVAWYRATPASADVAALATGLAVEIDAAFADGTAVTSDRVTSLAAVQQRPDVLARALSRSRDEWPKRLVVTIDDYHQITGSEAAETFVGELVGLLPATFVITTRTRPSWYTPRQTVYGEAVEVGTTELTMTEDEVRQVFAASSRPARSATLDLAKGWPVVIGLAASSGRTDLPSKALPRNLYEFLANELIEATRLETQYALTVLALTGTNERALIHELVGGDTDTALDEADRRGLLTFESASRIVLHPLLGEFLIERLRERDRKSTEAIVEPLIDALMGNRRWDECLSVAEALPDLCSFASAILEDSLQGLLSSGRVATVRRWVSLARRMDLSDPIVELAEAEVALRAGEYDRALAIGTRAAGRMSHSSLRSQAELVAGRAAHLTDRGVVARGWFESAEASAESPRVRAAALWGQFLVRHEEEDPDITTALERFKSASDGTVDHELRLALGRLLVGFISGGVVVSLEEIETVRALAPLGVDPLVRLAALNQVAWTLGVAARYEEAISAANRFASEAEASGIDFAVNHGLLAMANALVGLRQFAAAQHTLSQVMHRLRRDPDKWSSTNLAIQQARLHLSLGDLERAADCLALDPVQPMRASNEAEYDAYRGLIAAAQTRRLEASRWIRRSLRTSRNIEARAVTWIAKALLAVDATPEHRGVPRTLDAALRAGHHDAIVIGCRAQPDLARRVAQDEKHGEALIAILLRSNDEPLARAVGLHVPRTARRGEGLSRRETDVYELMIQGRTNREIAKRLFITESTTKVHVRHILEKLGVRSRVEAVRAWRPTMTSGSDLGDAG